MENPTNDAPARTWILGLGLALILFGCASRSSVSLRLAVDRTEAGVYSEIRYLPFQVEFFTPAGERFILSYGHQRRWAEEIKPEMDRAIRRARRRGHEIRLLTGREASESPRLVPLSDPTTPAADSTSPR